ncbi:MAG: YdcF family protein [Candidatus Nomurabacteria bacterium]|jgi:uncharacterized SAM-binding protein YcdF (DUF218 family)|nr:YdcF family protein [Candidatus Nomurabacteria bacterium]
MELSETDLRNYKAIYDYLTIRDEMPERADAIIVGGEWLRSDNGERAAELYRQGISDLIIFSGYADFGGNTTGQSEAEIMAERAIELGVPKQAIVLDKKAANTAENLLFAAEILAKKGIIPTNIILIHKPYMTRRFKATAEAQYPKPQPNFYVTSVADDFYGYFEREKKGGFLERTLWSMPGDYKRMSEYAKKGWLTPQPKDRKAERAFRELEKAGREIR